jgi:hypothetical protein
MQERAATQADALKRSGERESDLKTRLQEVWLFWHRSLC